MWKSSKQVLLLQEHCWQNVSVHYNSAILSSQKLSNRLLCSVCSSSLCSPSAAAGRQLTHTDDCESFSGWQQHSDALFSCPVELWLTICKFNHLLLQTTFIFSMLVNKRQAQPSTSSLPSVLLSCAATKLLRIFVLFLLFFSPVSCVGTWTTVKF